MDEGRPWYKRRASRRDRLLLSLFWIPGVLLAFLAEDLTLRFIGYGLMLLGFVLQLAAIRRSED